jgi:3-mercaptopyruvate sulfurtransferase SseA
MGAKEAANYYCGWSEWGNDDETPVLKKKSGN